MVRRVTVVALLVLWGAGSAEAMFGNTGAALYGAPIIGWGDFARTHVTADMAGFQAHPEYLLRSIHRLSDFKLDASDDALGVAYSCMMAAGAFGAWVQTRRVLREYRNKHPAERAAAKLAMRNLGNKNMFKYGLKHIEELRRDFGLTAREGDPGYKKDVASAAGRRLMYHHSVPNVAELRRDFGLTAIEGDPGYHLAVASAGGLRNTFRGALPHVAELRRDFGLTAIEGDPGYHSAVASAGGLRNTFRGALPHVAELRRDFGLSAVEGGDGYHLAVASAGGLRNTFRGALPHVAELRRDFGLTAIEGDPGYHLAVASAGGLRNTFRGALPHVAELRSNFGLTAIEGGPGYHLAVASAGGLRNTFRGALPHVAELKAHFGLTANEGDDDYEVISLSLSLFHSALPPIVFSFALILVRGCASHESYIQAQVASAKGRRDTKTQVGERLAKQIEGQQATPMSSHIHPNNQSALLRSETHSATGTAVIDAICARIAIQNDTASILALGESPFEVNGVLLQVGSRRGHFKPANDKIKACTQHLKKPGSRLSDSDRNAARKVAVSFVSDARFTDQDCVSYVYHRTLERISTNKSKNTAKKNNRGAGGRSSP
jgi:hypothetical protein